MILVWLLEANYTLNILVFLYWWQIIQGTFPFFFPGSQVADTMTHTLCSLNISNNSLYNASYYMCRKITSHWQPLFSKKMAAAASFSYKIGDGLIFQQNWRRRRQGYGNITGGCSDIVWILGCILQSYTTNTQEMHLIAMILSIPYFRAIHFAGTTPPGRIVWPQVRQICTSQLKNSPDTY